jgi:2-phosphosulfolactate phosphatase
MEILFTPSEYEQLEPRHLADTTAVVIDVLRATSTMVSALYHGAVDVQPVKSIAQALQLKERDPACLLAGERHGLRIRADATGGTDFDLGNSPREFTAAAIGNKRIIMTTTNGTRALEACVGARLTLICSFLNLRATADYLLHKKRRPILLICSGTGERAAYEDVLCAGALSAALARGGGDTSADSVLMAETLYRHEERDLTSGLGRSANGQRLLSIAALQEDVTFCATRECFPIVAGRMGDAPISRISH